METMEFEQSRLLLELKAAREGCWKLADFTAYAKRFTIKISPELKALLKIAPKAHPELQAMLVDLQQYKPALLVGGKPLAPSELGMEDAGPEDPPPVEEMRTAEAALRRPLHLPAKARFVAGPNIHVQFDGGA